MVDLPGIKNVVPDVTAPRSPVSPGQISQPYFELARNLDKAGDVLSKDVAVPLATRAGLQAVTRDAEGNIQVDQPMIIGDAAIAYSRAVKVAAVADAEQKFQLDDVAIRKEHRDDPGNYLKASENYVKDKVAAYKAAGPEAQFSIKNLLTNQINQTYKGLVNAKEVRDLKIATETIQTRMETMKNEAFVLARSGATGSPDFQRLIGGYTDLQNELVNNPLLAYPKEKAQAEVDHLKSELRVAAFSHQIVDRVLKDKGYDAAVAAADGILTDRSLKLSDSDRRTLHGRIINDLNAKNRDGEREVKKLTSQIEGIGRIAAEGYSPVPERLAKVRADVEATGSKELSEYLQRVETVLPVIESWRRMTPAQLQASLGELDRSMQEKGATETGMVLAKAGGKLLEKMRKEVEIDPNGWAERTGLMKVPPIRFGTDAAQADMQERIAIAEVIGNHFSKPPQYLRPEEQSALEVAASKGGAQMLMVAKTLADGFGDRATKVMAEIAKESPVLAHIGALLTQDGSHPFAMDVAEAVKMRNDEKFKLPKSFDNDEAITAQNNRAREVFGGAFSLAPESRRAAEAAGQAAYFARAYRNGYSGMLDNNASKGSYDRAMQESAGARFTSDGTQFGGVGNYSTSFWGSGTKVLVPANVRADRFREVITAIKDSDIATLPVAPEAVGERAYTARDLHAATPVATRGGYRFAVGDPNSEDPKWIRGTDGRPFVLDLSKLEPALRERVPGAFLGGR